MNLDWNLENKKEVLKIADILLCVSRKDNRGKKIDSAYTAFDSNDIFKYGCDRLNSATALVLKGYKQQTYGVWEEHVDFVHGSEFICSFCKQGIQHYYGQNFCDVCGSKMREEFEELGTDFLGEENNDNG